MTGTCIMESPQGKNIFVNGKCNHGNHEHLGNVCMVVTQPELENLQTEGKYCPCKGDPNLIRLFQTIGYTEPQKEDYFVTKTCGSCGEHVLLKVDEDLCMYCKLRPEFYEPVNRKEYEDTLAQILEQRTPLGI